MYYEPVAWYMFLVSSCLASMSTSAGFWLPKSAIDEILRMHARRNFSCLLLMLFDLRKSEVALVAKDHAVERIWLLFFYFFWGEWVRLRFGRISWNKASADGEKECFCQLIYILVPCISFTISCWSFTWMSWNGCREKKLDLWLKAMVLQKELFLASSRHSWIS